MSADKDEQIELALTERVIGAFFDVYNELGSGFLESVYENALAQALRETGIAVQQQAALSVSFRNQIVGEFRADLLIERQLVVELKAVSKLMPIHEVQLINYLKASGIPIGLLVNFGAKPEFKRRVFTNTKSIRSYPRSSA